MKIDIKNIDLDDIDEFPMQEKIRKKIKKNKSKDDIIHPDDNYTKENTK